MHHFFQDLLSQPTGNRVAPETLEMIGHKASQRYQQDGVPLNQAIKDLVAQHPELGNEHIRRVVEFANNVTFQEQFQNGDDKNVHFEVADPGVILRDLKDGGSSGYEGKLNAGGNDYASGPKQSGMQDSQLDDQLAGLFNIDGGGNVKTASEEIIDGHANPVDNLFDEQVRLQSTLDELEGSRDQAFQNLRSVQEDLYKVVRQEVVNPDGAGLGGVVGALHSLNKPDIVETILPEIVSRMAEEGYPRDALHRSLEKRAGISVNPNHPIITSFNESVKVAQELVVLDTAIDDVSKQLEKVSSDIRKIAGPLTSKVRDVVTVGGNLPAGLRQRFPRK